MLLGSLAQPGAAQDTNLVIGWQGSFGDSSYDYLRRVRATADGGLILGGSSASGSQNQCSAQILPGATVALKPSP